jgi:hypothetical protein
MSKAAGARSGKPVGGKGSQIKDPNVLYPPRFIPVPKPLPEAHRGSISTYDLAKLSEGAVSQTPKIPFGWYTPEPIEKSSQETTSRPLSVQSKSRNPSIFLSESIRSRILKLETVTANASKAATKLLETNNSKLSSVDSNNNEKRPKTTTKRAPGAKNEVIPEVVPSYDFPPTFSEIPSKTYLRPLDRAVTPPPKRLTAKKFVFEDLQAHQPTLDLVTLYEQARCKRKVWEAISTLESQLPALNLSAPTDQQLTVTERKWHEILEWDADQVTLLGNELGSYIEQFSKRIFQKVRQDGQFKLYQILQAIENISSEISKSYYETSLPKLSLQKEAIAQGMEQGYQMIEDLEQIVLEEYSACCKHQMNLIELFNEKVMQEKNRSQEFEKNIVGCDPTRQEHLLFLVKKHGALHQIKSLEAKKEGLLQIVHLKVILTTHYRDRTQPILQFADENWGYERIKYLSLLFQTFHESKDWVNSFQGNLCTSLNRSLIKGYTNNLAGVTLPPEEYLREHIHLDKGKRNGWNASNVIHGIPYHLGQIQLDSAKSETLNVIESFMKNRFEDISVEGMKAVAAILECIQPYGPGSSCTIGAKKAALEIDIPTMDFELSNWYSSLVFALQGQVRWIDVEYFLFSILKCSFTMLDDLSEYERVARRYVSCLTTLWSSQLEEINKIRERLDVQLSESMNVFNMDISKLLGDLAELQRRVKASKTEKECSGFYEDMNNKLNEIEQGMRSYTLYLFSSKVLRIFVLTRVF